MSNTEIKTTKYIYPQIYAYSLPDMSENEGWLKIGYTERQNVDERIREQTKTAAINLKYHKLWFAPAKFNNKDEWFKDKQFHSYLRSFKNVEQRKNTEWFYYNGTPELSLQHFHEFIDQQLDQSEETVEYQLREEQKNAVSKTQKYATDNPNGEFLWNAKPRFGKTLTTYDLACQLNASKVLIVTNRPAIANSWFDDFTKFIAWQTDFAFISTNDSLKNRPVLTREQFLAQQNTTGKRKMIAFISLQDLKGAISFGGTFDKLSWVKELEWDLLVIDEAHEGIDTVKTDVAFDNITRNFTLHLSGTPFKAVASGKFNEDEIFNWSYADEQAAKENWDDPEQNNPYENLPRLNLFSYQISQMITDEVNKGAKIDGENIDFAFDLNEFFETGDNGKFIHENDVKKWLDSLTKNEKYPFSTKELRNELKHTFWLLNRVASAKALQKLLEAHPVFENYKIVLAAGDGQTDDQVVNQKAFERVKQAIKENDKTITLSVGQLTTGVTIPEWTAVLMLTNCRSPSLYMQAAFRAQNPWSYELDDNVYQKQNAYVFDFAPERTLIIYDEFANNLFSQTANGNGTSETRKENIKLLLNFFPVIAEDSEGKMVELDVNQVLTIPKAIKAQEVVRRGFMSNLLFQNISGIFASAEVREILEQLNPVDTGKTMPRETDEKIETQGIEVDDHGEVIIDHDIVIAQTDARFGEKVYQTITTAAEEAIKSSDSNISALIAERFKQEATPSMKNLASENDLSAKFAERVVEKSAEAIAKKIEYIQKQTDIKKAEAQVELEKVIAAAQNQAEIEKAKADFEEKRQQIDNDFKNELISTVESETKELAKQSTQTILEKAEDNKKNQVEDDVRARLRGFSRTIPSFLMAYGESDTTLATFDQTLNNEVFKEVTGITLEQFRLLRDSYNFFDETVFNESVQEFLKKRSELANYFDESQKEDIFDYIPAQKTNQIFTPKKVVKLMIDKLEEENPDIFSDPNQTFADLYVKSGLYLTEIVKRLYVGLEDKIPDPDERLKHILENQVYGFAPSEIIYNIAKNFIFGFDEKAKNINNTHIVHLDTTPYGKEESSAGFEKKCNELFRGK
ncbi:TPA: DEAD/DEAH box helicase family protein [Pasteurella multocida]|nr:DEAD/DEAH box helicase family protein [Pasteurella multocida]